VTWFWCPGSGRFRSPRPRCWVPGGQPWVSRRWPGCRHGCWPPSAASTAITTTGPFTVGDSGHELDLGSIDGSVTRVPDTPANREAFGSTGTADDSGPYPQVRDLLAGNASTRATLAVVSGPSGGPKAEGEQALLDAMLNRYPGVFTSDRIWVLDRNFPRR